jgi:hypothetical protein
MTDENQGRLILFPGQTGAAAVTIDESSWNKVDQELEVFKTSWERYPEAGMKTIDE